MFQSAGIEEGKKKLHSEERRSKSSCASIMALSSDTVFERSYKRENKGKRKVRMKIVIKECQYRMNNHNRIIQYTLIQKHNQLITIIS